MGNNFSRRVTRVISTPPLSGAVGGYRVFFGDNRDTPEFIPVHERQSNNRSELRAVLRALRRKTAGKQMLIYADSLLVVDGACRNGNGIGGWG